MAKNTLYNKVWDAHRIVELNSGQTQLFVGRHTIHEVTSPQAFDQLRERNLRVKHPELTFATLDHIIPTDCEGRKRPFKDKLAEEMASALERNCKEFGITYFGPGQGQGVIHVVMPEQGVIWPGQVVVCGDSHTCTYGAFGALAFGIGTTEVANVLATQSLAASPLKVARISYSGKMGKGVTGKDVALETIHSLGVKGGAGHVYEFAGPLIDGMGMESRMTLCNMAVEGGARIGYVNPDLKTFDYLRGRAFAPREKDIGKLVRYAMSIRSGKEAVYDDYFAIEGGIIEPRVTWGVNPSQSVRINGRIPEVSNAGIREALDYMSLEAGQEIEGLPVDVVFIGSCTNGRLSDLYQAIQIMRGRKVKVRTLVVPGSEQVKYQAEKMGLDRVFTEAGAEWREPGCSMCLAMNPDKVGNYERCASTSNRNFKGRQGNPNSRTHLMSPYTAAATAVEGQITDPRKYLEERK